MLPLALHSNAEAPLAWLIEFFGPSLVVDHGPTPSHDVRLTIDPDRYAHMLAAPGDSGERPIDCFALDGKFEQLALWRDEPDHMLLHDARAQSFLSIAAGYASAHLVARQDSKHTRVLLMRVVRELEMLRSLDRGDLFIHGAAAVWNGRAVTIAGHKRSGKTSMLLSLLGGSQSQYISNDRVMVDLSETSPIVRGVPTVASVRPDSLQYLPALAPPVFAGPHRHYLTLDEVATGSALLQPTRHESPPMSPAQLCRWLGVDRVAAAPHGMLVFPRVDSNVTRFVVREMGDAEAAGRVHANLFSAGPAGLVPDAFGRGWAGRVPMPHETFDACRRLARTGSAWECRIGPLAFHAPDVWMEIASAISAS
jgi:hypothetical protein